ncbi:MAG: transglutaminase-like domain-containing protein [Clostridia bacterium]|nr:transglutaminase-like domain-containing protein [Clostridia bacterium]
MKRKLLIVLLTIISAVCLCLGFSACDILTELSSSISTVEQSSSSGESSEELSLSGDSSEQSSSDDEQGSPEDGETQKDSSDDSSETEKDDEEITVVFTLKDGNSSYGYESLASETKGTAMQAVYYQMYTACEEFSVSTEDVTETDGNYVISEISYSGSLSTAEALSVWEVFYIENPIYYWLSNTCTYSSSAIILCIDEEYASYSVRAAYDADISAMVEDACKQVQKLDTELEKAIAIHDYIIGKIDYAYQSDNTTPETDIWAHNITGVSTKGAGVCEAYAKTYLALCLINGIDCIIVTGNAGENGDGEGHAWNLVKIDGVWYGVDCTWDDTGDDDDLYYNYFGMNVSLINSTRKTRDQTYGVNYLYELPEVTTYGIQFVTLFKGETELGIYVNIDAAFAAMTDSSADYTIEFYFCNPSGTKVETSPSTTVYIYAASTPAVNSITINGIYSDEGNGYFYVSYLNMQSELVLACNLEISNIILTATELDLGEYTLTTSGYYCRLNGVIKDSKTAETVSIKSTISYQTIIYATLDIGYYYGGASIIGTAEIDTYYGSDTLVVYGTVSIGKYVAPVSSSYYIYVQNNGTLTVNNLVYEDDNASNSEIYIVFQFDSKDYYPTVTLSNVEAKTYLYIYGFISGTEAATPSNLDCTIATLGDASDFANILVWFINNNTQENKTDLYTVTDNKIVYKET